MFRIRVAFQPTRRYGLLFLLDSKRRIQTFSTMCPYGNSKWINKFGSVIIFSSKIRNRRICKSKDFVSYVY